jgi:molybdopterin-containing oxidoreductase family membrane subunit
MANSEAYLMGLFRNEDQVVDAIKGLTGSPFRFMRAHSPIPSHKIMDALELKKSKVGWFTLAGGVLGFFSGFALAIFTATRWHLIVSGKPIISLIPFFIVGFEFTVLFAVFGNVIGLLTQTRLPSFKGLEQYDPRCSGEHFGLVAACAPDQTEELAAFFRQNGAEIKTFEPTG